MALNCLLDENMDVEVAHVLTALGSPTTHLTDVCDPSASDREVLEAASEFDALITIDLFRQPNEWQAAKRAMLESVRIVRIRFGSNQHDDTLEQARALLWRWREIEREMEVRPEVRLATLRGRFYGLRFTTLQDLQSMPGPQTSR